MFVNSLLLFCLFSLSFSSCCTRLEHCVYRFFSITRSFTCFAYKWAYDTIASSFRSSEQIYLHKTSKEGKREMRKKAAAAAAKECRRNTTHKPMRTGAQKTPKETKVEEGHSREETEEKEEKKHNKAHTQRERKSEHCTKLLKNHHIKYLPPPECTADVVANNNQ